MTSKYAHELTWEAFQQAQKDGVCITDCQGRVVWSRDRRCGPKEAWSLYREAVNYASFAGKPIAEEIIRSNNDIVIPMIDGEPAPVSSAPGPELSFMSEEPISFL